MHLKTSKIDSSVKRLHCLVLEVRHGYYPEIVVANMSIYQINRTRSEPHGTFEIDINLFEITPAKLTTLRNSTNIDSRYGNT